MLFENGCLVATAETPCGGTRWLGDDAVQAGNRGCSRVSGPAKPPEFLSASVAEWGVAGVDGRGGEKSVHGE